MYSYVIVARHDGCAIRSLFQNFPRVFFCGCYIDTHTQQYVAVERELQLYFTHPSGDK